MTVHRVRVIDIDGGRIGKVWEEYFFLSEKHAKCHLKNMVDLRNAEEPQRYKNQHTLDTIENIQGYCWRWSGVMYCYDCITVE